MLRTVFGLAFLSALTFSAVNGQDFSLHVFSPEVPGTYSAADIVTDGGGPVLVPSTWLGLAPADVVNGFSYGADFVRPVTSGNPLAVRFSVGFLTVGAPLSAVNLEAMSNGAAGDIFWGFIIPNGGPAQGPWKWKDATSIGLSPLPIESNVNGVEGLNGGTVPPTVYFTVDPATAAGLGVSPADVLYQGGVGPGAPPPTVFASEAALGLQPGDNINALAVFDLVMPGTYGIGDFIFISFGPASPSLAALGAFPSDVIEISVFAPPFVTMTAGQFGLLPSDGLNAVTCYDIACMLVAGDANHDGTANVSDAVYLVNYIFKNAAPPPCPNEGDANGDGQLNVADAVYMVNYVFQGGPAPVPGTVY